MASPHKTIPRIAVFVDTASGWGRRIIRGIANYGLKHGPWELIMEERGRDDPIRLESSWKGDGIIARVSDTQIYKTLIASRKPVVNISAVNLKGVDLPCVTSDYDATARLALQHFRERGFRNVAYCGIEKLPYVERLYQAFKTGARACDMPCDVFFSKVQRQDRNTSKECKRLLLWLKSLPKPVGIFTWATTCGRDVLNMCLEAGIPVPNQVAVLASDDDDLLCDVCYPPMSGILMPCEQIGYEAARIMDALLQGGAGPASPLLLAPIDVHTRLSTDTIAIDDPEVCGAIRFIRENIHHPFQVADVVAAVNVSRRSLERRFATTIGRSLVEEIQQTRIARARKLLRETEMSVADVAAASGYCAPEYMSRVFHETTGHSPLKYRTWTRAR
jgi:LacI family transcriptional regulator